jgi:hypothetical protein
VSGSNLPYYKGQKRTEAISIKPGLKQLMTELAPELFPCAEVGPNDVAEYIISTYMSHNEVYEAPYSNKEPEVRIGDHIFQPTVYDPPPVTTVDHSLLDVISTLEEVDIRNIKID